MKVIFCKLDLVYYCNCVVCYNVLSEWEKVVEDIIVVFVFDNEYIKVFNCCLNVYDYFGKYSEVFFDIIVSCIIDGFRNE